MTAQRKLPPMMTVADFIDWPGDGLGTRFELIDGELRAMAPASETHGTIQMNVGGLLWLHLRGHPRCRALTAPGVQPRVRAEWNFRVPDLGVTCALDRAGQIMAQDPVLLIEVLSPGNVQETYEAVRCYATLPSVRDILIVHSTRVRAELWTRDDKGDWPMNPVEIDGGLVPLVSIDFKLDLAEAYAGTHLIEGAA
jgi:Uma2 family endonuclease